MVQYISSVPVVGNKGALVNIFSRRALQLVDKKGHPRFGICTRSDTLYHVITLLSNPGGEACCGS
ncbi:hypothetical protein Lser_V15G21237 [Lactuca serriola]